MPGRNIEEKAHRTTEVRRSSASWCGVENRTGNNEKSCGLLRALWTRQRTYIRPGNTVGPIVRKPLESTLKRAGRQIATIDDVVELRAAIEHDRRHALTPNAGEFGIGIRNSDDLLS